MYGFTNYNEKKTIYQCFFFFFLIIILRKTKNERKRVVFPNALCGQHSLMYLEA